MFDYLQQLLGKRRLQEQENELLSPQARQVLPRFNQAELDNKIKANFHPYIGVPSHPDRAIPGELGMGGSAPVALPYDITGRRQKLYEDGTTQLLPDQKLPIKRARQVGNPLSRTLLR